MTWVGLPVLQSVVDADLAPNSFKLCNIFVLSVISEDSETTSALPDLLDRLRVRRWKRVSVRVTLIQPAPGYYYQVPGKWNGTKQRKIWDCCSNILTEICLHQNIQDQDVALDGRIMFQDEERWICVFISLMLLTIHLTQIKKKLLSSSNAFFIYNIHFVDESSYISNMVWHQD